MRFLKRLIQILAVLVIVGAAGLGVMYHLTTRAPEGYNPEEMTPEEREAAARRVETQKIPAILNFAGQAQQATTALLAEHADLDGIWAVWDVPAEGVLAALQQAGNAHVIITTIDLGKNVAIELARGGRVKGIGAQRPFDQGVTEATLAGFALLGETPPADVFFDGMAVTRANVLEAWKTIYRQEPPAELQAAAKQ